MISATIQVTLYLIAILNVILSVVVFSRGLKNITNILFGAIALFSALWSITIIGFYNATMLPFGNNWVPYTHLSALIIALAFFYFSVYFPRKLNTGSVPSLAPLLPFLPTVYLLFFTNQIVGATIQDSYIIGPYYIVYSALLSAYFFSGYFFLYKQFKGSQSLIERNQVKYVLIGALTSSTLALIPDLILPFIGVFSYTWLGPVFTALMVVAIFLAMLRYQLFSIKVILTEIFVGLIVIILCVEIILAKNQAELFLKAGTLVVVVIFSYLLIRSIYKEVATREQIEKLAKDLEKANVKLIEADKQKSEFVSIASHQLRGPLAAIKGYGSLILEGSFGTTPPAIKEAVQKMFDSSQSLVIIVQDYLDVSRIEQGRMKYDFSLFNLKELIENLEAELKPTIEKSGLQLSFTLSPQNKTFEIFADRGKIKQVIGNFVDNAVKYTKSGSIIIELEKNNKNNTYLIKIKDTGVGIAKEVIPKLFNKFTRAPNANEVNVMGSGLGLYVASEMVRVHRGRVWAESEGPGRGSIFFIELPQNKGKKHEYTSGE